MHANAIPRDTLNRVLYRPPANLWINHWLRQVGTRDDLEQEVYCLLLEPEVQELIRQERFWYVSGLVATRLRSQVARTGGNRKIVPITQNGEIRRPVSLESLEKASHTRNGRIPRSWGHRDAEADIISTPEEKSSDEDTPDPFVKYIHPKHRQFVRDYFTEKKRPGGVEKLCIKYGASNAHTLRIRIARIISTVRRKYGIGDPQLRPRRVRKVQTSPGLL